MEIVKGQSPLAGGGDGPSIRAPSTMNKFPDFFPLENNEFVSRGSSTIGSNGVIGGGVVGVGSNTNTSINLNKPSTSTPNNKGKLKHVKSSTSSSHHHHHHNQLIRPSLDDKKKHSVSTAGLHHHSHSHQPAIVEPPAPFVRGHALTSNAADLDPNNSAAASAASNTSTARRRTAKEMLLSSIYDNIDNSHKSLSSILSLNELDADIEAVGEVAEDPRKKRRGGIGGGGVEHAPSSPSHHHSRRSKSKSRLRHREKSSSALNTTTDRNKHAESERNTTSLRRSTMDTAKLQDRTGDEAHNHTNPITKSSSVHHRRATGNPSSTSATKSKTMREPSGSTYIFGESARKKQPTATVTGTGTTTAANSSRRTGSRTDALSPPASTTPTPLPVSTRQLDNKSSHTRSEKNISKRSAHKDKDRERSSSRHNREFDGDRNHRETSEDRRGKESSGRNVHTKSSTRRRTSSGGGESDGDGAQRHTHRDRDRDRERRTHSRPISSKERKSHSKTAHRRKSVSDGERSAGEGAHDEPGAVGGGRSASVRARSMNMSRPQSKVGDDTPRKKKESSRSGHNAATKSRRRDYQKRSSSLDRRQFVGDGMVDDDDDEEDDVDIAPISPSRHHRQSAPHKSSHKKVKESSHGGHNTRPSSSRRDYQHRSSSLDRKQFVGDGIGDDDDDAVNVDIAPRSPRDDHQSMPHATRQPPNDKSLGRSAHHSESISPRHHHKRLQPSHQLTSRSHTMDGAGAPGGVDRSTSVRSTGGGSASSSMKSTLKEYKGSGAGFDTKLRAFLHKTKQEHTAGGASAPSHGEKSMHKENSKSSIVEDDCATLITCAESVKGESKAITGNHRDLLKIAKLTSRPGNQPGSVGHLLNRGKSGCGGADVGALATSSVVSELTTFVDHNYSQLHSPQRPASAQTELCPPPSALPLIPSQDSSELSKPQRRGKKSLAFEIMNFANMAKNGQLSSEMHSTKRCPLAFRQATILSLKAETVLRLVTDPYKLRDHGTNCFQPFFIESADVMYQYPQLDASKDETILGPDVLSAFCFPYGVSVRFFPRAALEGAKRVGWFGESGDKYQLKAFTSMTGATKHGVALVVQEELQFDSEAQRRRIIASFKKRMARRRAIRKVVIWWRRLVVARQRKAEEEEAFQHSDSRVSAAVNRVSTYLSFAQGNSVELGFGRSGRVAPSSNFTGHEDTLNHRTRAFQAGPQRMQMGQEDGIRWPTEEEQMMVSMQSAVSPKEEEELQQMMEYSLNLDDIPTPFQNEGPKKAVLGQRRGRAGADTGGPELASLRQQESAIHSSVFGSARGRSSFSMAEKPDPANNRHKEAYQTMLEHEQLGYTIVVETCYVFTDVHPEQQVPLFCAMQQIIEKQREHQYRFENDAGVLTSSGYLRALVEDEDSHGGEEHRQKEVDFAFSDHYDVLFDYMHKKLRLGYRDARVTIPSNSLEFINQNPAHAPKFDFRLPLSYFDKRSLPLPLPNMTAEYGLSRLLLTIRHEALLMVLKVLLLERSVLVVGETVEEVTCCTCTLLQLLQPFTWASAFMPLIRSDMLEFVSSPVPFLAGMVARDVRQLDSIKSDVCVKEAVRDGLSIIDLYRGRLTVTSADGIWEMLVDAHLPCEKLMNFQTRLEYLASNEDSTLHSFKNFFKMGFSAREQLTLSAVKHFLGEYLANLANAAVDSSEQLDLFCRIDADTDTFEFEHDEFAELRRKQVLARVNFFDEMSKTQLFLGYVEEKCRIHDRRKDLMKGIEAMVIAHWGITYWPKYKERKRTMYF